MAGLGTLPHMYAVEEYISFYILVMPIRHTDIQVHVGYSTCTSGSLYLYMKCSMRYTCMDVWHPSCMLISADTVSYS